MRCAEETHNTEEAMVNVTLVLKDFQACHVFQTRIVTEEIGSFNGRSSKCKEESKLALAPHVGTPSFRSAVSFSAASGAAAVSLPGPVVG